jgi:hypothetical protein
VAIGMGARKRKRKMLAVRKEENYSPQSGLQQSLNLLSSKTPVMRCKDGKILLSRYNPAHVNWFEEDDKDE